MDFSTLQETVSIHSSLLSSGGHRSLPQVRWHRQRRRNMSPSESEDCCSNCCCCLVGCLCFCSKTKKTTRIKVLWGWLLVLSLTSCLVLGCVIYSPDTPLAAPSDMRPVTKHIDFLFCEEVLIDSPGLSFDAFRFNGELVLDDKNRVKHTFNTALFVDRNSFNYFSFYFLDGSLITIDHCSRKQLIFYVFNGKDNFDSWKKNTLCEECYFEKLYLQTSGDCSDKRNYHKFDQDIAGEGEWFFVYSTDGFESTWVDTDVTLNRSVYNLENATPVCSDVLECNVDLKSANEKAVFRVNDYYDLGTFNHPQFTTKCVPRIWTYMLVHGAFVLIIGISCSVFIQKFCRNEEDERISERTPLFYDSIPPPNYSSAILAPPNYNSAMQTPPKYEDVMGISDPPSYVDAIHALSRNVRTDSGHRTCSESSDIPRVCSVNNDVYPDTNFSSENNTRDVEWLIASIQDNRQVDGIHEEPCDSSLNSAQAHDTDGNSRYESNAHQQTDINSMYNEDVPSTDVPTRETNTHACTGDRHHVTVDMSVESMTGVTEHDTTPLIRNDLYHASSGSAHDTVIGINFSS